MHMSKQRVAFLWEILGGECLDVEDGERSYVNSLLVLSIYAECRVQLSVILGEHHEVRMLKFYWTSLFMGKMNASFLVFLKYLSFSGEQL